MLCRRRAGPMNKLPLRPSGIKTSVHRFIGSSGHGGMGAWGLGATSYPNPALKPCPASSLGHAPYPVPRCYARPAPFPIPRWRSVCVGRFRSAPAPVFPRRAGRPSDVVASESPCFAFAGTQGGEFPSIRHSILLEIRGATKPGFQNAQPARGTLTDGAMPIMAPPNPPLPPLRHSRKRPRITTL